MLKFSALHILLVAIIIIIFVFRNDINLSPRIGSSFKTYRYEVIKTLDHRPGIPSKMKKNAPFTQGLFFLNDNEYIETSGLYGESYMSLMSLSDQSIIRHVTFPTHIFAEGATLINLSGRMYILVLSWLEAEAFLYSADNFELVKRYRHPEIGWGLTSNGEDMVWATRGDHFLLKLRKPTLHDDKLVIEKYIEVKCEGQLIKGVNELEYHPIRRSIFVNIFGKNKVIELDPESGECVGEISFDGLFDVSKDPNILDKANAVMNGLAWHKSLDCGENCLLVTGKLWPKMYIVRFNM